MQKTQISHCGFTYSTGSFEDFSTYICNHLSDNRKIIIVHINLYNYYLLHKDTHLKESIKKNCLLVFDGIGMKIAFLLRKHQLLADLNGTDLFPLVMKKLSNTQVRVFLLGAEDFVVKQTKRIINEHYPDITICGYHNGYFSSNNEKCIVEQINQSNTQLLLISRGFPLQELFALRNKDALNVSLIWNVGGLFDFISGNKKRAPLFFRKIRLEWLFRLFLEPRRMLFRNSIAASWSIFHILLQRK